MFRDVVAPVHEHVGHDVPEVDGGVDAGDRGGREGEHVAREAGHGDGHDFMWAESSAQGGEEKGEGRDLPRFLGVWDNFVVLAVAAMTED